jgi:hypothetical protein
VYSEFEYPAKFEKSMDRFKPARTLFSVILNTLNISGVFRQQVISAVRLKGHSSGMSLKSRRWRYFFRAEGKSKLRCS